MLRAWIAETESVMHMRSVKFSSWIAETESQMHMRNVKF
jgi:hypothetical protein